MRVGCDDPPLTQDHRGIPVIQEVFRRPQPVAQRGSKVPFEQDRLAGLGDRLQEWKLLHVARANLEHVGILSDDLDQPHIHDLGDDWLAGSIPRVPQISQAFLPVTRTRGCCGTGTSTA